MKINVAKSAGFCFGVKRALDIAFKTAHSAANVCMLGDIVHNEDVISRIERAGIKKINKLGSGKGKTLLIRAHGTNARMIRNARHLEYSIVDATCPMVKEIHKIATEMERQGFKIIVIGDRKHDEVQGIIGQLRSKAIVIDGSDHIPLQRIKMIKKGAVVVQSTQNLETILSIVEILKKHIKELKFFNTICRPTRIKQAEIKILPLKNDVMIIIGSRNSANTKRLYEISKSLNRKSYWINSKEEMKAVWFKDAQGVGITAGASTPDYRIKEIVEHIKQLA